jgi:hypothetical protein
MRTLLAIALTLSLAAVGFAEDSIRLKSGRTLRGTILQTGETVVKIRTDGGVEWVKRADIEAMSQAPAKKKVVEAQGDAERRPSPQPRARVDEKAGSSETERVSVESPKPELPAQEVDSDVAAKVLSDLGDDDRAVRAAAATWVVENWPASARVVDSALVSTNEAARLEAVRLLDDARLGNNSRRLVRALTDASAPVRIAALRAIRHRGYDSFERDALRIMQDDPEWVVRQEAIRTLEDIGTAASLRPVIAAWSQEADEDRRRRYRRVLRAILLQDFGDDADRWRKALDEVHVGRRKVRGD